MENTKKVYAAICGVLEDLSKMGITKGRTNEQQGYAFRGIDDIYDTLASVLAKHKLCIIPRMQGRTCSERQSRNGGALFCTAVDVEYDFVSAEDGSMHTARVPGEAMDSADKSTNKAMSAAYKYLCMQTFCIPTKGDNDADGTTHEVAGKKSAEPAAGKPAARDPHAAGQMAPPTAKRAIGKIDSRKEEDSGWVSYVVKGVQMSTKKRELIERMDAMYDAGKGVVVEYSEQTRGRFTNRYVEDVAETVPEEASF